jgi:phosphatidylinositol kinase/protein kinase (PI-3  family)
MLHTRPHVPPPSPANTPRNQQVLRTSQEALLTVVQVVLYDPMYNWQMNPVKAGRKQQDALADNEDGGDAGSAAGATAGGGGARTQAGAAASAHATAGGGGGAIATLALGTGGAQGGSGGGGGGGTGSGGGGGAGAASSGGSALGRLGNADAERAVLRVKQKLQGQDVAGGAFLGVPAYVGALIEAARDPENLCRHFVGWAAWT